jgi:hypothetical protein
LATQWNSPISKELLQELLGFTCSPSCCIFLGMQWLWSQWLKEVIFSCHAGEAKIECIVCFSGKNK